mgnify:CR=1 FL=1
MSKNFCVATIVNVYLIIFKKKKKYQPKRTFFVSKSKKANIIKSCLRAQKKNVCYLTIAISLNIAINWIVWI